MSNVLSNVVFRKRNQRQNEKQMQINTPNGIVENTFIKIGGIDQWISIRGENINNPILFIVHGGPASIYSIFQPLLRSWEKHFTVVQWDQPGTGKTFRRNGGAEGTGKLTFERIIRDGINIVEYLQEKMGQRKVILVGSSVGSLLGIAMAHSRPDLFYAYVGTDQNSPDPDQVGYRQVLDTLYKSGNKKGYRFVEQMGPDSKNWNKKDFEKRNQLLVKTVKHVPHMIMDLVLPAMLSSPMHDFRDMMDYFKGMNYSLDQLFQELMHVNETNVITSLEIPLFIFHGDSDIVTPTVTAKAYFDKIKAPHKEFVLIKQAGHLACFARPNQFLEELLTRVLPHIKPVVGKGGAQ